MRAPLIIIWAIVVGSIAHANTVLIMRSTCDSPGQATIGVTQTGVAVSEVHIDVYRQENGHERFIWAGVTNKDGFATPPKLLPGEYRVVAASDNLSAEMNLVVGKTSSGKRCVMDLSLSGVPRDVDSAATISTKAPSIRLSEFRGVVQDENEAVIPRLKIAVLRKEFLNKGTLAETQSDQSGQFILHLDEGSYVAVFSYEGFRRRAVAFEIGDGGWKGFRLTMIVGGSSTRDTSPQEWNPQTESSKLTTDSQLNAQTH